MKNPASKATWLLATSLLLGWISLNSACTVTSRSARDQAPSFDGAAQNSGFLGYTTNGAGVITPRARDRYNALIDAGYGTNFLPAITRNHGVSPFTNGTWLITPEALVDFGVMNQKRKSQ